MNSEQVEKRLRAVEESKHGRYDKRTEHLDESGRGLFINRLIEEEVASIEDIDIACQLGLGHPIGPYALMDLTTNPLNLQVQQILFESYGERFRPRPVLKQMVNANHFGKNVVGCIDNSIRFRYCVFKYNCVCYPLCSCFLNKDLLALMMLTGGSNVP